MAKSKAELQYDRDRHGTIMAQAKKAVAVGNFQEAVNLAVSAPVAALRRRQRLSFTE